MAGKSVEGTSARGRKAVAEPIMIASKPMINENPHRFAAPIARIRSPLTSSPLLPPPWNGSSTGRNHSGRPFLFSQKIHAIMDASEIQSTELCEGCGKVSKEKAPELRRRKGRIRKVMETVFGFKIWVVWDPVSRLPLAMRFCYD